MSDKIKIVIITDCQISLFVQLSHVVLLGCDSINNENGNILNKTGSFMLALSANQFNTPVYIISNASKIVDTKQSGIEFGSQLEQMSHNEIIKAWKDYNILNTDNVDSAFDVFNIYFEVLLWAKGYVNRYL